MDREKQNAIAGFERARTKKYRYAARVARVARKIP